MEHIMSRLPDFEPTDQRPTLRDNARLLRRMTTSMAAVAWYCY